MTYPHWDGLGSALTEAVKGSLNAHEAVVWAADALRDERDQHRGETLRLVERAEKAEQELGLATRHVHTLRAQRQALEVDKMHLADSLSDARAALQAMGMICPEEDCDEPRTASGKRCNQHIYLDELGL